MDKTARNTIINLGIIRFSKWFMLYMPIVKLFYEQNGLNNFQLFSLQAIHALIICLTEIPSGYAADLWGRKNIIMAGTILNFAGFVLYSFSAGFWGFLLAEMVIGFGVSFVSGSDSAMLYDTLSENGLQKSYLRYEGRLSALGNFSESFAGLAVSAIMFLGITNLRYAYVAQSIIAFVGIPASFLLREPVMHVRSLTRSFRDLLHSVKKNIIGTRVLRYIILYSSLIGFATLIMAWFAQIFFFEVNLDHNLYGVLWTALNITVGLGSLAASGCDARLGAQKTNLLILVFLAGIFLVNGLVISTWAIAFLFVFYFVRGIATPVLKEYINRIAPSEIRATVLSVRSFMIRIFYFVLGPFFGWISDTLDLATALILTGITVLISGSVTLAFYKHHLRDITNLKNNGNN
ncbi:MAG: MFS transporter [Bacteroidales bacterium]|nr:MFS transporter [Bacteroidales bacterium]